MKGEQDRYRIRFHLLCQEWGIELEKDPAPEQIPDDLSHDIYTLPQDAGRAGGGVRGRPRKSGWRPKK